METTKKNFKRVWSNYSGDIDESAGNGEFNNMNNHSSASASSSNSDQDSSDCSYHERQQHPKQSRTDGSLSSSSSSSSSSESLLSPKTRHSFCQQHEEQANSHEQRTRPKVERWILPSGAEQIIRQIAAEQIIHELLDRCCSSVCGSSIATSNNQGVQPMEITPMSTSTGTSTEISTSEEPIDFAGIEAVAREFPGTCCRTYEFKIDTRDKANRVREMLPLTMLCCLNPPLHVVKAVYEAYPDAIRSLDPAKGATPLLYACSFEASLDVINFLIAQHPESVRIPRSDGAIPLAMACSYRAPPEVVDRLIQEYPQGIKQSSVDGWYPIHAAVACEAPVLAIQRLYEVFPESITDAGNSTRSTALHLACSKGASVDVVAFLIHVAPECINMEDLKGMTPWFWAVYTQSLAVIQLLMNHSFPGMNQLPIQSPDGIFLLHYAARQNTPDVVEFLAQKFPNMVSARSRSNGMTPLHTACRRGRCLAVVQALVRNNPRCLFIRNHVGRFPLDEAREAKASDDVIEFLVQEQRTRRAWWW